MSLDLLTQCFDPSRLPTQRQRAICAGTAHDVSIGKRLRSLEAWLAEGLIEPVECDSLPAVEAKASKPKMRGLGDAVARLTSAVGIKPCGGCKKRQEALNKLVPFGEKKPAAPSPRPATTNKQKALPAPRPATKSKTAKRHPFYWDGKTPELITAAKFMEDTHRLMTMLPPDTSRIVGVARSGLCAASMIAMLMHRPISIVRQSTGDLIDGGNGWRLSGATKSDGPVVVIDDTCMTGNSFKHVTPIVKKHFPNVLTAVVYCNPNANVKPDIWAKELPWVHVLLHNAPNSIVTPVSGYDFDGILCHDCPRGHDDDGPLYAKFLAEAKPLYYVRKHPIPLIVTARLEKYRAETMDWLKRHGMSVRELVMWPRGYRDRTPNAVAEYKAAHFKRFAAKSRRLKPALFIESDPWQAKRIAELSGGITVCPAAGRCFP